MVLLFTQAVSLTHGDDFILYRSVREISDVHFRFLQDGIDTMEKVFRFAVRQHGQKPALGTREILAEEDEMQPNGRVFKKVYFWLHTLYIFFKVSIHFFQIVCFGPFPMANVRTNRQ